ncbi:AmmeMemoRadiSam system protein B [Candidatus Peregrinibacteria bacterium]|nr:AmmeMemoRadiSam system protein B [Candidatus Peregrinibacteria bacterium]
MNKLIILCGIILAVFLLFKINSGEIATNDVFRIIDVEVENNEEEQKLKRGIVQPGADGYFDLFDIQKAFYDRVFERVSNNQPFRSNVYGAILPSNFKAADDIAEFFVRLKETQNVKKFVILGENHSWKGNNNIASSRYGYKTPYGNLEPDINFLEGLNVPSYYYAFNKEYSVAIFASFIKKTFPNARIVPIVIKDFEKDENLEKLANDLAHLLNEGTLVIASTDFAQGINNRTAHFHDELAYNVIETFDKKGISQLDVDSKPVLKVLFDYLELSGGRLAEIHAHEVYDSNSYFLTTFHEGVFKEDRDLTVTAFGDMMLGRYVRVLMDSYGLNYIFENIEGYEERFFEGADVIFGNLEGPIKGQGSKGGTSMIFAFNEDIAPFLREKGFTLLSISNNHALDRGWSGRESTISALEENGIGWCGHPTDADFNSVHYGKVRDKSYAFLCFQDVTHTLDDQAAVELIKTVRPNVDYLVVSIHWGYEYKHTPARENQISPGRAFIDAGADFIIGHHPHVVQSFEEYKGKLILYSLGNFVFDQYWSLMTQEELAIGLVLDDMDEDEGFKTKVYLFPMKSERSQSRLMTEKEYDIWIEKFINYGEYSEDMKDQIRSGVVEIEKNE